MKRFSHLSIYKWVAIFIWLLVATPLEAQIVSKSQTKPIGLEATGMRSAIQLPTLRLGQFDQDSARIAMERETAELRVLAFAHKQVTSLDMIKEGRRVELPDGQVAWYHRVSSPGAKSLNLFFDQFELPAGATLSIYDSHNLENFIGPYSDANNNRAKWLSTELIHSQDVVVEVVAPKGSQEPLLRLAEVNHGVIEVLRATGPTFDLEGQATQKLDCTPEVVCHPSYEAEARSVVMIIIDGTALGTGVMLNNSRGDGKPLLMTAAHVVSHNFNSAYRREYSNRSAKVLLYFNYQSPYCSGEIRPQTTQTLSGGKMIGVDEEVDAILIELTHRPPNDYKPYYAGWNAEEVTMGGYSNIHHPNSYTKRINFYYGALSYVTYPGAPSASLPFANDKHLKVDRWDIGTTAGGSSGSPLYDKDRLYLGGLSGGYSYCNDKKSDYFFSLHKVFQQKTAGAEAIKATLSPNGATKCDPMELYSSDATRAVRITHIAPTLSKKPFTEVHPQMSRERLLDEGKATALAERYLLRKGSKVFGIYLVMELQLQGGTVPMLDPLKVQIFGGESRVPLQTHSVPLIALMEHISRVPDGQSHLMGELYLPLPTPLELHSDGAIYIAITHETIPEVVLPVHQVHPTDKAELNTLYYLYDEGWVPANRADVSRNASLWIDLMVSEAQLGEKWTEGAPLFTIKMEGEQHLVIELAERAKGATSSEVEIFTLQGEYLYRDSFQGTTYLIPRHFFEHRGLLIVRVTSEGESRSEKVLFLKR